MLPPQTPTRTLLKNLRRQSSAWTLGGPPPSPPSLLYPAQGNETEDFSTYHDGLGDQTLEQQLDALRGETTDKDEKIRQLQSQVEDLTKKTASHEAKDSVGKGTLGLTWGAARTLEREFEAQEMILKGLQRDNEEKTIEVESLRRQMRTMSAFLDRHHGSDWEMLVFGQAAAITNRGDLDERPLPGLVSSPSTLARRGLNIPRPVKQISKTTAFSPLVKMKSPLSHPHNDLANETFCDVDASFVSAQADTTTVMLPDKVESMTPRKAAESDGGAAVQVSKSGQPNGPSEEPASTSPQGPAKTIAPEPIQQKSETPSLHGFDSNQILAHLESTRMLLHSFARTNARRQEELRRMEETARQEGEKAKRYLKKDSNGIVKG